MPTLFSRRARRNDPNGHMVVQDMLDTLRDVFDGFVGNQSRGNSTVPNTATTVLAIGAFPATYSVVATPLNNPGGAWWISNKTSTQFQINLAVAAGVGGVSFDWITKGA